MQALEQVATLRSAAGDDWSEYVPEEDILALLTGCGRAERPLDLAVLLRELDRRGRRLAGAVLPPVTDAAGRSASALTSWLPARVGMLAGTSASMLEGGAAPPVHGVDCACMLRHAPADVHGKERPAV